jgi:hypothetical protein
VQYPQKEFTKQTLSRIEELEHRLGETQAAIQDLERLYQKCPVESMGDVFSSLESMRDRRNNIVAAISDTFCLLGPFRPSKIPLEVLQSIFQIVVIEMLSSPYAIAAVCRSWRRAAFSVPAIWSRIALRPSRISKSGPYFTPDGYEICSSRSQLKNALRRARCGPLHIRISGRHLGEDRVRMAEMLPVICGDTSRRWQSVDLDISQDCDLSPMIPLFLNNLESASVNTFSATFFVALEDALNLSSFSVTSDLRTLTVLQRSSIWSRLKTLIMEPPIRAQSMLNETRALEAIVGSCQSLQSFTLHTRGTVFIPTSNQLVLPCLTFTTVLDNGNGVSYRAFLSASLTHLVIRDCTPHASSTRYEEVVTLPQLTHLTLYGREGLARLPGFVCPSLDTLAFLEYEAVSSRGIDGRLCDIWVSPIGPGEMLAPKKLHLRQLDLSSFILCACLNNISTLEEVRMEEVHMPSSFFVKFLGGECVGEGRGPMCPNLRYFEYKVTQKVYGMLPGNPNSVEAIIRGSIANRKDCGKRLRTVILDLHDNRTEYRVGEIGG